MKKITFIVLLVFSLIGNAVDAISQNTVTVSGSSNWVGYANVFGLDGTSFEFGSAWGLADVKSVVNVGANSITLSPNFNAYVATDAYWANGAIGNKIFEGNTFVENSALAGQVLTFSGNVVSNTLASGYTAVAFIKGLNPATGYSTDVNVSVPLVSGQAFTLTTTTAIPSGLIVQYGFTIKGLNGNPANEVALGNVVVEAAGAPPVMLTQMTLPVTFDDVTVDYGLIGFGGAEASTVEVDPTLGSNKVVKVIKSGTAELWAGTTVTAAAELGFSSKIPFTATETKMNVRVWSPNAGIQVRLKVEDHTNNGITCETEATVTTASGWQTLEFNFANQASGTAALDITKNFDKASIFFNFGVTGATAGEKTYYFDDVKFGAAPSVPSTNDLVLPIDFESSTIAYSFTDFDGGVATKIANPHSTGINTSANVAQIVKGAGAVWAGSYLTLPTPVDFSTNKIFKVKVWSPVAGKKLLLKFEGGAGGAFEKESTPIAAANTWEELTFDFSAVGGLNNLNNKIVLIFDLGTAGDGSANSTYLLDDITQTTSGGGGGSLTQMTLPVTFDDVTVDYGLIGFGGAEASTVEVDPTLGSNKVVKVIKSGTAELWAGTTVTAAAELGFSSKIPFTATETKMNVRVWSPNAGIQVRLKVEDHTNNGITCETEATVTTASGWQTLEFNFANQASGTAALDITKNFDKASIFFNFGVTGATAGEKTYYFDDVKFGAAPSVPSTNDLVLPIDFESSTIAYSFTDFDGGVATKIANPHNTGINTSANVAQIVKGAGAVWAGSYLTLPTPVDFSTNKIFKVKVWSPVAGKKLLLKFEGGAGGAFEKESSPIAAANTWEELTFDFSAVGGLNNLNNKIVLIFDLGTAGDGSANSTYLLDDIVQTNTLATIDFNASKVSMYPNPTSNYLTIEANSTINRVAVYNILGQEVLVKSPKSNATTLQTSELKKGVYIVKTDVDGKLTTAKIIKE